MKTGFVTSDGWAHRRKALMFNCVHGLDGPCVREERQPALRPQSLRKGGLGECCWVRVSEISRTDHVTVDNAVLDAPRSPRSQRGVCEGLKAGSWRQSRATWFTRLHSSPTRGTCGASKGAVPKGARYGQRTHTAGCGAGQPEQHPTRSRMLGECSIRVLVASFEEAHLPRQPIKRVHAELVHTGRRALG